MFEDDFCRFSRHFESWKCASTRADTRSSCSTRDSDIRQRCRRERGRSGDLGSRAKRRRNAWDGLWLLYGGSSWNSAQAVRSTNRYRKRRYLADGTSPSPIQALQANLVLLQSDTCAGCGAHSRLGTDSSTFVRQDSSNWSLDYSSALDQNTSGGRVSGSVVTDTMMFTTDLSLTDFQFGIAEAVTDQFGDDRMLVLHTTSCPY